MKKAITLICVFAILFATMISVSASITCEQVHYPIFFNGSLAPDDDKPILSLNWNTYVPLRKVCEGSGLEVFWNQEKQEIYVENVSALAAQDYANLSKIYSNTATNHLYQVIFLNAFYEALEHLQAGEYTFYETCLNVMNTYEKSIDLNIDSTEIHMQLLYGYYDGTDVTKKTYEDIENCLRSDLVLSISCNDLTKSLVEYANGNITYKKLSEALNTFNESTNYARGLVVVPGATSTNIVYNINQHSKYFYCDYQSMKPNLQ